MGWLSLLVCALPLYLFYHAGHPVLWVLALTNAITNLWTFGMMHNYAVKSSAHRIKRLRQNLAVEGKLNVEKEREIDQLKLVKNLNAIPTWSQDDSGQDTMIFGAAPLVPALGLAIGSDQRSPWFNKRAWRKGADMTPRLSALLS